MSGIERIIEAMTAPSPPAAEVVTLQRATIETILAALEDVNLLHAPIHELRTALAEPKVELWAIHSVGPGEQYPCLNKEDAEQRALELRELGERMKQERIARGESVEHWQDWVTNVIPSPWEPAEHFEILAEECVEDADQLRQALIELKDQRNEIVEVLKGVEKRCEGMGYVGVDGQYLKVVRTAIAKATQ